MRRSLLFLVVILGLSTVVEAEDKEWATKMEAAMPSSLSVKPMKARKVLLFSVATGYKHSVIPRVKEMFSMMASKTKVAELVVSDDVAMFEATSLSTFDAVILNNTCSHRKERHLFRDILLTQVDTFGGVYKKLPVAEREAKAASFEKSLIRYVESGKGLMVVHGAITFMNQSADMSRLIGGSFDYHPKFQEVTLTLVEPEHPLLKGFNGKSFVHKDEPYVFNGAYLDKDFRPLLKMDTQKLKNVKEAIHADDRYVAWIRSQDKGRVFFTSPSHGAESYTRPELLQFYLDGLQYVLGDLKCDDSVSTAKKK